MSIVINGMDMPKGNSTKNLLIYSDGRVFTGHKDDANYSAEERKTGKWIYIQERGTAKIWTCSECGWNDMGEFNYCPYCGADMREGQDEQRK